MKAVNLVSTLRAAALVLAAVLLPAAASAAPDATGVWLNDTGRGAIEIKPCGDNLCGHVVWVKDGSDAKGCGRQIIGDAQPVKAGVWDNGWIYSPEKKKRYDVELKPMDSDRLRVTGYAGSKFFSKTMIWKRAPADLTRCGTDTATADPATPAAAVKAPASQTAAQVEPPETTEPDHRSSEAKLRDALRAESQPAAAAKPTQEASNDPAASDDSSTETADAGDLGLASKLEKYLKRENGKCALDLPWIKVDFKCKDME